MSFWLLADLIAPSLILGQAIGRIGCFLNGCCFGIPMKPFLCMNRHPTQIYEMALDLAGFFLLWSLRKKVKFEGGLFLLYLMAYGVIRSIVSQLRADNVYLWNSALTLADFTSIVMFIAAMVLYIKKKHD
jgi:phosphatidylglycerol:prolipoprotein diacylglycerol transferase